MITGTPKILAELTERLDKLSQEKSTGELVLKDAQKIATIYFFSGRLLYVVNENHRVRTWKRAIKQHCATWDVPTQVSNNQPWEYDFLYQGISKKSLSLNQVKAVVGTVAQECFCELVLHKDLQSQWIPTEREKSALAYCITLSLAEIHPILTEASDIYHHWHTAGLDNISPNLSPKLTKPVEGQKMPIARQFLNGNLTLWDIALETHQAVNQVTQDLLSLKEQGILVFEKIPDLMASVKDVVPTPAPTQKVAQPSSSQPATSSISGTNATGCLIACIDDSPVVSHNLKKILQPAGYRILSIQEPMAGFAQLIEHKPDLILLDLNMPNANGYSICKFLRETPVFGKTPIIILTAQDTVIDRARAKLVGATDFISKPPNPKELVQMIQKYLAQSKSEEISYGGMVNQPAY